MNIVSADDRNFGLERNRGLDFMAGYKRTSDMTTCVISISMTLYCLFM
ncbi:hypothetical protein [Peribacillus simplex]